MATQEKPGVTSQIGDDGVASRAPMDFNEDAKEGESVLRERNSRARNPRDEMVDGLGDRLATTRGTDEEYFLKTGGARAALMAAELRAKADEGAEGNDAPATPPPAAKPPAKAEAPAQVSDGLEIVEQDGQRMMKLKIDGAERLVPVGRAVAQMQKGLAAEIRLQQASERVKQLDTREAALRTREAELVTKGQPPVQPDVDDQGLDEEAQILVKSLLTDSEDEAAAKLAKVLKKVRQAPRAPQIDLKALASEAASVAKQELRAEKQQKDIQTGFERFQSDYPELAADPILFNVADQFSDQITKEHPEWEPDRVMDESGKATRAWLEERTGKPAVKPSSETNGRQARKETLKPMPPARGAQANMRPADEPTDTPSSVLAEIRKGRGQAS